MDDDAGSANIYLVPGNIPPNFFCAFTSQDDWSFEFPADIIESTRTPAPDTNTVGQPLEEGYIPCSPVNPNPFQEEQTGSGLSMTQIQTWLDHSDWNMHGKT